MPRATHTVDLPAHHAADQFAERIRKIAIDYASAHLALSTSDGDRHRLSRAHDQLGLHIDALSAVSLDNNPTSAERLDPIIAGLRDLRVQLASLCDGVRDSTVTGRIKILSHPAPGARGGRPKKVLSLPSLHQITRERYGVAYTARIISKLGDGKVCARTVRRRLLAAGIVQPWQPSRPYTDISDNDLHTLVDQCLTRFPGMGVVYVMGYLKKRQVYVQRYRVELAIPAVRPQQAFLHPTIRPARDVYWCAGPNSVWHHDGQHGLVNFGIVIHAFIDGFSRTVTSIRASTNNKADTVLDVFVVGIQKFGTPSRVRGDRGGENVKVAKYMIRVRGDRRGSYLWGVYVIVVICFLLVLPYLS